MQIHQIAVQSMSSNTHVIICGYGHSGQALARFMEQEKIKFIALDLDSRCVQEAVAAGESVVYGDAAKREILLAAGLMRAKTLVVTYNDVHSALKILHHVKELRPDLPVVVRTSDDTYVEELKQAGAAEVVAEVLEGGIMLASQVMLMSGVPLNRVIRCIQENRARRYSVFSGFFRTAQEQSADEDKDSTLPRFHSVLLEEGNFCIGKTLDEMNLVSLLVEVNSVRRHNVRGTNPAGDMVLRAGDVLVLLGPPMSLLAAEERLRTG